MLLPFGRDITKNNVAPIRSRHYFSQCFFKTLLWLGIVSKLPLLSLYAKLLRDIALARHSEQAPSALALRNVKNFAFL